MAGEEPPADPVERIILAAPVPGRGLLSAAADLVECRVGEPDHVEVVHDEAGVGQAGGHRGGVGLVGVDHHVTDPGQPRRRLRPQPVGHRHGAASSQNIDDATLIDVDDPRHQQRRVLGGGRQKRRLIEPQRARGAQAGEVVDAGPAVIAHGGHGRVPGHPEVPGRLGDGMLTRPDQPTDLGPGPFREHRPRGDLPGLLGPGPRRAGRLAAAPKPLGPHQHHRAIRHRQVANDHPPAAVADRPHPADLAPGSVVGGLHRQPPLAARVVEQLGGHDEPTEPDQR